MNFFSSKKSCFHDKCTFQQSYTEGSTIQGYELEDIVWPGTSNIEQSTKIFMQLAVPMTFGCESRETGLIASQFADGIMGLSWKQDNIVSKMYQAGSLPYNAFSICLTKSDGFLSFGGTSASLVSHKDDNTNNSKVDDNKFLLGMKNKKPRHLEKMKMVPISKNFGYYSIDIKDFRLGGISITSKLSIKSIFNGGTGTIIDSGTSDTYLPKRIEKDFNRVWYQLTKQKKLTNSLQQYTDTEFERLPNITFILEGGHEWTIQPSEYMEEAKRDKGFYNRIYLDEPKGAVLGANAIINHDILFDMNNRVIGIARAECS